MGPRNIPLCRSGSCDCGYRYQTGDQNEGGRIVSASIRAIQPGRPGKPGEKIGLFDREGNISGRIISNSHFGVFGVTDGKLENNLYSSPLPVAYAHQVKKGKAQILTVINERRIECFDIIIEKVYPYRRNGKGMVLRVIDEDCYRRLEVLFRA